MGGVWSELLQQEVPELRGERRVKPLKAQFALFLNLTPFYLRGPPPLLLIGRHHADDMQEGRQRVH